jgi:hypothetical protein
LRAPAAALAAFAEFAEFAAFAALALYAPLFDGLAEYPDVAGLWVVELVLAPGDDFGGFG